MNKTHTALDFDPQPLNHPVVAGVRKIVEGLVKQGLASKKDSSKFRHEQWIVHTQYGDMLVTPYHDWIALRFLTPDKITLGQPLNYFLGYPFNYFTGKWNIMGPLAKIGQTVALLTEFSYRLRLVNPSLQPEVAKVNVNDPS